MSDGRDEAEIAWTEGGFVKTERDLLVWNASFCPPTRASLQQLSPVQGRVASEPPQPGAPCDSWARGCGEGTGKKEGVSWQPSVAPVIVIQATLCACVFVYVWEGGRKGERKKGGSFYWVCLGVLEDCCAVTQSLCNMFPVWGEAVQQPSASLAYITAESSRPLVRHSGIYGVFFCIRPLCQNSDLLLCERSWQI